MGELEFTTEVLARHWREQSGMTYRSPDRCVCGARTLPVEGDEDISDRRARAFARHQALMLADARFGRVI